MSTSPARWLELMNDLSVALEGEPFPPAVADYLALLEQWGEKLRLTGAREPEAVAEVALADALLLSDPELVPRNARFVDVGAGAGAPSIPLVLLRSDLRAVLVEPLQKRTAFLRTAIGTLGIMERVEIRPERLEAIDERFDLALSRATFAPSEWLLHAIDLAPQVVVMTSGETPPPLAGQQLVVQRHYRLPSGSPRWIGRYAAA